MDKELYMKIKEFTFVDELITKQQIFECESYESLGECIYGIVKLNCLTAVESEMELKKVLLHPKKMQDYASDDFYEVLAKEECHFKELPINVYNKGLIEVNEILLSIESIKQEYILRNNIILNKVGILEDKVNAIKEKIKCDRNILKPLALDEIEKKEYLREKRLLELEYQQRNQIYKEFENSLQNIICEEKRLNELKLNSIKVSKKDLSEGITSRYVTYKNDMNIFELLLEKPDNVFYRSKLYFVSDSIRRKFYSMQYVREGTDKIVELCNEEFSALPSMDTLRQARANCLSEYKSLLDTVIHNHNLIEYVENGISSNYCIKERITILTKCLEFYNTGDFTSFNNIIASQIEGMFNDFMNDITTFIRMEDFRDLELPLLRKVLEFLRDLGKPIPLDMYVYFFYYYVDQIRNPIAHGDYFKCIEQVGEEVLAREMLMDMVSVIYLIEEYSESSRMKKFFDSLFHLYINKEDNRDERFYPVLLNELLSKRIHSSYNQLEYMNKMEVLYWGFNSYYEERLVFYGVQSQVDRFRKILISAEFWEFVIDKLNSFTVNEINDHEFTYDFKFVVSRMFKIMREFEKRNIHLLVNAQKKINELFPD